MGKAKFFLGAVGTGTRMKLCVNMVRGGLSRLARIATYGHW
jgi:3-hydroxyisobutyrate dehydrogenase-like beta-hydroxyacid dehydrogenase